MVRRLRGWVFSIVLPVIVSVGCGASSATQPGSNEPTSVTADGDNTNQAPLTDAEKAEIADFIEEARKNFENGQDLLFSKRFTNDGKIAPPQAVAVLGKSNIAKLVRKSPKITSLTISNLEVEGAGKNAVATGTVAMDGLTNDPDNDDKLTKQVSVSCSLLITLKKNNAGNWRAKNVSCPSLSP
ncbi:MAG: hypothetical protein JRE82_00315 [Deltaproteobacteria bacterium]|nr:hypothetical protein [Deltaproteobacteria bacterium]MBW2717325.1 hypothetical protein [Deltaproteobacteria bacterium]